MIGQGVVNNGNTLQGNRIGQQDMVQATLRTPAGVGGAGHERMQVQMLQRAVAQQYFGFLIQVAHNHQMFGVPGTFSHRKFQLAELGALAQRQDA